MRAVRRCAPLARVLLALLLPAAVAQAQPQVQAATQNAATAVFAEPGAAAASVKAHQRARAEQWANAVYAPLKNPQAMIDRLAQLSAAERMPDLYRLIEHFLLTEPQRALQFAQQLQALAAAENDVLLQALVNLRSARALMVASDKTTASMRIEDALFAARAEQSPTLEAQALTLKALVARELGQYSTAIELLQQALDIERALASVRRVALLYIYIGLINIDLHHYDEARAAFADSARQVKLLNDGPLQVMLHVYGAEVETRTDHADVALAMLDLADRLPEARDRADRRGYIAHQRGLANLQLGRFDAAAQHLQTALQLRRDTGDHSAQVSTLKALADLAMARRAVSEARQLLQQAVQLARQFNLHGQLPELLPALASVAEQQGDLSAALALERELTRVQATLFDERTAVSAAQLQTRLNHQEQQARLAALESENKMQSLHVRQQQLILWIGLATVLLAALITWMLTGRLRQRRLMAEAAMAARGRFLAQMSHEIRTPMNGIIGVSDLLAQTPLNADQRELSNTIRSSGEALLALINDILDLSKLEAGKLVLVDGEFDLRELIESVQDLFAAEAERKGLILTTHFPLQINSRVRGDEMRLRQILVNLLGNAIRFTDRGSVEVSTSLVLLADQNVRLSISIADTGIGIPETLREVLFEPFVQAEAGAARRGGTGLGLSICKQLARLMHGDIRVSSVENEGSVFTLDADLRAGSPSPRRQWLPPGSLFPVYGFALPPALHRQLRAFCLDAGLPYVALDSEESLLAQLGSQAQPRVLLFADSEQQLREQQWLRTRVPGVQLVHVMGISRRGPRHAGLDARSNVIHWPVKAESFFAALLPPSAGTVARLRDASAESDAADAPGGVQGGAGNGVSANNSIASNSITNNSVANNPVANNSVAVNSQTASSQYPSSFDSTDASHNAEHGGTAQFSGLSALVVDDNEINRRVAEKLLGKLGLQAASADSGESALERCQQQHFDVVFMDCQMPGMDGYRATEALRKQEHEQARARQLVIAMTANALKGDRERCLAAGMDDYLAKPVKLDVLAAMLERWCASGMLPRRAQS